MVETLEGMLRYFDSQYCALGLIDNSHQLNGSSASKSSGIMPKQCFLKDDMH